MRYIVQRSKKRTKEATVVALPPLVLSFLSCSLVPPACLFFFTTINLMPPVRPKTISNAHHASSPRKIVLSLEAEAMMGSTGENTTSLTVALCPGRK